MKFRVQTTTVSRSFDKPSIEEAQRFARFIHDLSEEELETLKRTGEVTRKDGHLSQSISIVLDSEET